MKAIHLTSLGCPKNLVDSEVMVGLLEKNGWHLVSSPEEANVLLVNTCGFIQPAVEEGIEEILELATYKNEDSDKKLVVTGCMVQRYREKLKEELPEIDLLAGTEAVKDISRILDDLLHLPQSPTLYLPSDFLMDSSLPRRLATPSFRAWMKITEGCDNCCSYCMIPSIRGSLRSRELDDLVSEGIFLEKKGVKELTLIAQDLTAYGTEQGGKPALKNLVESLLHETSIPWIRLLYLYPSTIRDDLLEIMASNSRIVPYLDIPFQHVATKVLQRMNRRYGYQDLIDLVCRIRRYVPDVALRTTLLLGFPGESEADIHKLEEFLGEMRIDHVGVFPYANEEGSPSEFFQGQLSESEKQARVQHILGVQAEISEEICKKYIGRIEPVIVEGVSSETDLLLEGRTRYQAPEIDGCVYINDGYASPGDIVKVKISESQIYDLVGAIVE